MRSVNTSVQVQRIALVTLHTCPLDRPGAGDAGGMNVYIDQTAQRLADSGIDVHVFTRATFGHHTEKVEISANYTVHHIPTSLGADLRKEDLPSEVDEFAESVRTYCAEAGLSFDLIHSHYWLSGIAAEKLSHAWSIPFVHTMHTMAKVKNLHLADGDFLEPEVRIKGEEFLVAAAHRLIVNTHREAAELIELYDAAESKLKVVYPGVDLETFSVADGRVSARKRHGVPTDALVLLFVGRLQPLKAPDALLRAAAHLIDHRPDLRDRLQIMVCGGPSGVGVGSPESLVQISEMLRIGDRVKLIPPTPAEALADLYRMADVVVVPSHSESFGLVALESQACGTPVVASAVGGLVTAVKDGQSGVLVSSRDDHAWAVAIEKLLVDRGYHDRLAAGAITHAQRFSWDRTTQGLKNVYTEALLNFPKTIKQKETDHQVG